MDLDVSTAEEGEIVDSDDNYTPLERPKNYATNSSRFATGSAANQLDSESDEDLVKSSSSDSDPDAPRSVKRPKVKVKRLKKRDTGNRESKFLVWSNRSREDALFVNMNSCDVTTKDMSRSVESYYVVKQEDEESEAVNEQPVKKEKSFEERLKNYRNSKEKADKRKNNKRTRDDRKNQQLRPFKKNEKKTYEARLISNLKEQSDCTNQEFAVDLANKLCEEKEDLILKVVNILGQEKSREIFNDVRRIEKEGGMMIKNQSRRRTPGGVFLFLVRLCDTIPKEQMSALFDEDQKQYRNFLKAQKKLKATKMKAKIAAQRLAALPTRAEIEAKLSNKSRTERQDSENEDVVNPPPTPETDGHVDSADGMEQADLVAATNRANPNLNGRTVETYDDDCLNLNIEDDMDEW